MRVITLLYLVAAVSSSANAQPARYAFPPAAAGITTHTDVEYGTSGTARLAMDVYKPAGASASRVPALIFFNRAQGAERSGFMNGFYAQWARTAAANGVIGILPDLRDGSEAADFRLLMRYLEDHGAELGIGSIGVY